MENSEYRLKRHTQLWEEQNKLVKRTVIASLFFGLLILLNVLRPYSNSLNQKRDIQAEIEPIVKQKEEIEHSVEQLSAFEEKLNHIRSITREQPWMAEKDKLIRTYADMRERGEGGWDRYQEEADKTVLTIASQVSKQVAAPLNEFLKENPKGGKLMPELFAELKTLPEEINTWEQQNLGKRWYRTYRDKEAHVESLSYGLMNKLGEISRIIRDEQPNLISKKEELAEKITSIENDTGLKEKEELIRALDSKMQAILPEWIRGMISVEQMIQLYPFIILGLIVYIIGVALSLTAHYRHMLQESQLSSEVSTDPIFSSLWTLTFRGHFHTVATIATYCAFMVIMWILFEIGSGIFHRWLLAENSGFLSISSLAILRWLSRGIFVLVVAIIIVQPVYHKSKTVVKTVS